jgi:hypothetical protein
MIIAGATGSGKTQFLTNLLLEADQHFDKPIQRLVYCYGAYIPDTFAKLRTKYPKLETYEGVETNLNFDRRLNNLLVLDDLMSDSAKSDEVSHYFTRGSHHLNLTVILLTQNFFHQGVVARTINRNAHYVVKFKDPRDNSQISALARQIYPGRSGILTESFKDATERPHGYLLMDFRQDTPDNQRLKTNILNADPKPAIAYVAKRSVGWAENKTETAEQTEMARRRRRRQTKRRPGKCCKKRRRRTVRRRRRRQRPTKRSRCPFAQKYCRLSTGRKIAALKKLTPSQLKQIVSLFAQLKSGRARLPKSARDQLARPKYKSRIRQLLTVLRSKTAAKRLTSQVRNQTGGFWGLLLSTALPLVAQYVYDKFK